MIRLFKLLLLLTPVFCFSQDIKLSGIITDHNGDPLKNAIVTLKKNGAVYLFRKSNNSGYFEIEFKKENVSLPQLCVSFLGFKDTCITVSDNITNYVFRLVPFDRILNDVIVRTGSKAVKISGDTTIFNVKLLSDGSEKKLEDVLQKLPGVRIDDNGIVSFKGKKISKILLDGEDFFSNDYRIISKNLSASLIESVEAYEGYQEEELFKNVQNSNDVVLNVGLIKSKPKLFGELKVGVGTLKNYSIETNLFSFLNKIKLVNISNINTIGIEPSGAKGLNQTLKNGFNLFSETSENSIIRNLGALATDRTNQSSIYSSPNFNSVQINSRFNSKVLFKGNVYLNKNTLNLQTLQLTSFFLDTVLLRVNDNMFKRTNPSSLATNFFLEYKMTDKTKFKFEFDYNRLKLNELLDLNTSSNFFPSGYSYFQNKSMISNYNFKASFINKVGETQVFELMFVNSNKELLNSLVTNSERFLQSFQLFNAKELTQFEFLNRQNTNFKLNYYLRVKKNQYLSYSIDFFKSKSIASTNIDSLNFRNNSGTIEKYTNDIYINNSGISTSIKYNLKTSKVKGEIIMSPFYLNSETDSSYKLKNFIYSIIGAYSFNKSNKIGFAVQRTFSFPTYNNFSFNNTIIDNNTLYSVANHPRPVHNQGYFLQYSRNTLYENGTLLSIIYSNFNYTYSFSNNNLIEGSLLLNKMVQVAPISRTRKLEWDIDKFISPIKSTVKVLTSFSRITNYDNFLKDVNKNNLDVTQISAQFKSGFASKINFRILSEFSLLDLSVVKQDLSKSEFIRANTTRNELSVIFSNTKGTLANLTGSYIYQSQASQKGSSFLMDFRFSQTIKSNKLFIELYFRNILNNQEIFFNSVATDRNVFTRNNLLPRMLFLSATFRL